MKHTILKKYEHHWFTLRDAKYIKNLKDIEVVELEKAYNELINPTFRVNKFCGSCVAEMVTILYKATKYDEQEEEKFSDSPVVQEFLSAFAEDVTTEEIQQKEEIIGEVNVVERTFKKRGRKKKK